MGSMSVFRVHPSTPPSTMEPNKGRQPAGHLTCGTPNCNTNPKATVVGIPKEPVLESAELITSRLTGAGSLLPPVYGEAWAKGHATGTPDSTFPRPSWSLKKRHPVIEKGLDHPGLGTTLPHQQKIPARGKKICDHPGLRRNAALATKNS
ncbi:hypothetical protein TNCV_3196401 [Trichonephila clavipes]|nr:hypothetical protein TNCV_3196401 [Trichonephila clavipes]